MIRVGLAGRVSLVLATAALVGGCVLREAVTPTQDLMGSWSNVPLAPSAQLAALAAGPDSICHADHDGLVRVLIQDRRTESSAAFLIAGATTFGGCMVTDAGGAAGSSSGPAPAPLTGPISIDENGGGGGSGGETRQLGGRVAPNAVQVEVVLAGGGIVTASLGNGYWLAWWPGAIQAERVVARDGLGLEIASEEVPR